MRKIYFRNFAGMAFFLIMTGCQKAYIAPNDSNVAEMIFIARNDSIGTSVRKVRVLSFPNSKCANGMGSRKIAQKMFSRHYEAFGPIKVVANKPFTFAVTYLDARAAQNRDCSVTATFTPLTGHSYKAAFDVVDDVSQCGLKVQDNTFQEVSDVTFESPEYSCVESFIEEKVHNGQAGWLNYK